MLCKHDHDRVDAWIVFRTARRTGPRPASPHNVRKRAAIGAETMPVVPSREAERGCENRPLIGRQMAKDCEGRARAFHGLRDPGEPRLGAFKAEEQVGRLDLLPDERAILCDCRKSIHPDELARRWLTCKFADCPWIGSQRICTIEAGSGEEGFEP